MAEGHNWARSQFEACPQCGADPSVIDDPELGRSLTEAAEAWVRVLTSGSPPATRVRPEPGVWSALEYGCHTRDVINVFETRISVTMREADPSLGWWDHEAAVRADGYNRQDPFAVVEELSFNAERFAATLAGIGSAGIWDRGAQRRPGEEFTIRGMARFVLHETIHHRGDAEAVLSRLA